MDPGIQQVNTTSPRMKQPKPTIELTNTDPKIYGSVKNVFFGPDMTKKTSFSLNQPGTAITSNMYTYSNSNRNSVIGKRRHFFLPNNYTTKKYGVRSTALQFYSSIPIYRMTIEDAIDVAKKSMGVILCNKTPVDADPKSIRNHFNEDAQKNDKLAAFEIVWIDKLPGVNNNSYNQAKTKTISVEMFNRYKKTPSADLATLNHIPDPSEGSRGYMYEKQDQKLSENLFMNLLRLSIKEGRTSGVISYLSGGRRIKSRHRRNIRNKKTRKN